MIAKIRLWCLLLMACSPAAHSLPPEICLDEMCNMGADPEFAAVFTLSVVVTKVFLASGAVAGVYGAYVFCSEFSFDGLTNYLYEFVNQFIIIKWPVNETVVEKAKPANGEPVEAVPVAHSVPVEKAKPANGEPVEAMPVEKAKPVGNQLITIKWPVEKAVPEEKTLPVAQAVPVEELEPADETPPVDKAQTVQPFGSPVQSLSSHLYSSPRHQHDLLMVTEKGTSEQHAHENAEEPSWAYSLLWLEVAAVTFLFFKKGFPKQERQILSTCVDLYYAYKVFTYCHNASRVGAFVHCVCLLVGFFYQLCTVVDLHHAVQAYQQKKNADTKKMLIDQYACHLTCLKCFWVARLLFSCKVHYCIDLPCLWVSYILWSLPFFSLTVQVLNVPEIVQQANSLSVELSDVSEIVNEAKGLV